LSEIIFADYFHEDVLIYAGIVSVWYALDYHYQLWERERQAAELEKNSPLVSVLVSVPATVMKAGT
jgi:hypothetical protein